MQNVRKYLRSVPKGLHPAVVKHVYRMHYARSVAEYDHRVAEAIEAWKGHSALREFERHFSRQWLSGRFTQWQCFTSLLWQVF
jgi:hypothetical protein